METYKRGTRRITHADDDRWVLESGIRRAWLSWVGVEVWAWVYGYQFGVGYVAVVIGGLLWSLETATHS